MANEKSMVMKKNTSQQIHLRNIQLKNMMFRNLDFHRFLDASLDKLSITLTTFFSLDVVGKEDELFKKIGLFI